MNSPLRIAIAGLGTVGGGTLKVLLDNADALESRSGRKLRVTAVAERAFGTIEALGGRLDGIKVYDDALALADDPEVDVIVELIGGSGGIAKALVETAIAKGKHVVTANKAMLAHHGTAMGRAAEANGVTLGYEAAVAGGIPIIKAMREGLAANRISRVYGILNGTCNYILTEMRETGREFDDVLAEAQKLGYAEADPSFDVEGIDAAHKVSILTSVAFGCEIDFDAVSVEGIRHISPLDIEFAEELGYRIKLLGVASLTDHGIEQRVTPCMVPKTTAISSVEGVFNAVVVEGDFIDTTMFYGRGAGEGPTASAVVSDLVDIARGRTVPTFGIPATALTALQPATMDRHVGAYYVRLMVVDRPGVFADVAAILRDNKVSMESVIQRGRAPGNTVPVVLSLHDTEEAALKRSLESIANLDAVVEPPRVIRIEHL
ncbi:MAG: homoserine dehydrogenase [Rhodospirillales bacterium]|nr:homoserine dehydrogenase [Rhodospirillales bacterium]MCW9040917.1 homoserine dehydrogenase [Rhodospirillales bacterium]